MLDLLKREDRLLLINDFDKPHKEISRNEMLNLHRSFDTFEDSYEGEDLPPVPSNEDYVYFPFRHISATTVGAGSFQATDLSKGNILKKSTPMLEGLPAYTNHMIHVGYEVGVVGETSWQGKKTNSKGNTIPAGINAPFIIDRKLYPSLVRKLSSPMGSPIDSASVTIFYGWEPSHDFERPEDFYWHLGEMIDGDMVRRVVEEVFAYEESSFVWRGADPYAKMLDNNDMVPNPDLYATVESGSFKSPQEAKESWYNQFLQKRRFYTFESSSKDRTQRFNRQLQQNFKTADTTQENAGIFTNFTNNKKDETMDDKLKMMLATAMGVTPDKLNADVLAQHQIVTKENFTNLQQSQQQVNTLTQERDTLKSEVETLKTTIEENKAFNEYGKELLSRKREEAKKLYNAYSKGKPEEVITNSIDSWELDMLDAQMKLWGGALYERFGVQVDDDGKPVFRSSQQGASQREQEGGGNNDDEYVPFFLPH